MKIPGALLAFFWTASGLDLVHRAIPVAIVIVSALVAFVTSGREQRESSGKRFFVLTLSNSFAGVGWGLLGFFSQMHSTNIASRQATLLILVAVVSIGIAANSASPLLYAGFAAPVFVFMFLGFLFRATTIFPFIAIFFFAVAVSESFRLCHHTTRRAMEQRVRADNLASKLAEALRTTEHESLHDPLTGAGNRRLLSRKAPEITEKQCSVICLDLDHFKKVNDTFGHAAGDELLVVTTDRIRSVIRPTDDVVRLGGDEFLVVLHTTPRRAQEVADRLLQVLREPFRLNGRVVRIGASIGVASSAVGEELSKVHERADAALYSAKAQGRGRVVVHSPVMTAHGGVRQSPVTPSMAWRK
jgi:diguanylate cyclase (GGDEF)-like protein